MRKKEGQTKIKEALSRFVRRHFRYFNWLRIRINFIRVRLFKYYSAITVYARKSS